MSSIRLEPDVVVFKIAFRVELLLCEHPKISPLNFVQVIT